jgi:peptidoglycan hydrolase CwlO-like protein
MNLTDNEIIKEATEAYNQNLGAGCYVGDLLKIIKHQQMEIEYVQENCVSLREYCNTLMKEIDKWYLEVSAKNVEIKQLKVEIEKLKEQLNHSRGDEND